MNAKQKIKRPYIVTYIYGFCRETYSKQFETLKDARKFIKENNLQNESTSLVKRLSV